MTKNSGEMPNGNHEPKEVVIVPEALHFSAEGNARVESAVYITPNVTDKEARDAVEEHLSGLNPEIVELGEKPKGRNMASAAFGRWNSGWETEADRKKRESAHLN